MAASVGPNGSKPADVTGVYYDEEECLSLPIFIAELELLVAGSGRKGGKPDGVQLLELLQKLLATIPRTEKALLKQYQRQAEGLLYDILMHGVGAAVRRLIYACFSRFYAYGDMIAIYQRVSGLQAYLSAKEGMSRSAPEAVRVGLLECLAHLFRQHGRSLASAALESVQIAARTAGKAGNQAAVRVAGVRLACAVVSSMNPLDRSAPAVQGEAWALIGRNARDKASDEVRAGCMVLLGALAAAGGGVLWRDGAYALEEAVRIAGALVEDPAQPVCDAAARALGEMAAAAAGGAAAEALAAEKRPAKKSFAERAVGGCFRACMVAPLVDAVQRGSHETCLVLSCSWLAYMPALFRHRQQGGEGQGGVPHDRMTELMHQTMQLINAVNEAGRAAPAAPPGAPDAAAQTAAGSGGGSELLLLGSGLSGGEMPALQATAIYVIRRSVIATLSEPAQRALLRRLGGLLGSRPLCVPATIVVLEGVCSLLDALGEVQDDEASFLEGVLQPHVVGHSAAVRQHASAALAALAAAQPASAARMLAHCLGTVASCAQQLAAGAPGAVSPANGAPSTPLRSQSPTPLEAAAAAAAGAAMQQQQQPAAAVPSPAPAGAQARVLMDATHGAALSAARLLVWMVRSPLGCPVGLQQQSLELAEALVVGPAPEAPSHRAIVREVGYLLLGALCWVGVAQASRTPDELLGLWRSALGEPGRKELDERGYARAGGDVDLAVQLWWRSVALHALCAYVAALNASAPTTSAAAGGASYSSPPTSTAASRQGSFGGGLGSLGSSGRLQEQGLPGCGASGSGANGSAGLRPSLSSSSMLLAQDPELVQQVLELVQPMLDILDSQGYMQEPVRARGGPAGVLAGAAAMFTLRLLELHLLLPSARTGTGPGPAPSAAAAAATPPSPPSQWSVQLAQVCLRPFRGGLSSHAAADALQRCALRGLLGAEVAPLRLWPARSDPLEEELRAFAGERGAPHLAPWHATAPGAALSGSPWLAPAGAGAASPASGGDGVLAQRGAAAAGSFPQPVSLGAALLAAQMRVLGKLLVASPAMQQQQIMEVLVAGVQTAKNAARQARDAAACRRLPLGVAGAVVTLSAFGHGAMAARKAKGPVDPTDRLPDKLLQLAQTVLPDEEATGAVAAPMAAAAAELFAAAAAAGSEPWALRVVRALCTEIQASAQEGRDPERRAPLALAIGCVHRARGGLAMQGAVASSSDALVAAASRPGSAAAAAWALHGLYLLACSGGGAFVPRVRTGLQLAQELLVSSFDGQLLRSACARLANAAVAVLGPEFTLGSQAYTRARSLVSGGTSSGPVGARSGALLAGGAAAAGPGAGAGASAGADAGDEEEDVGASGDGGEDALESVLFVQQLILFAPHAVPHAKHVPMLTAHLLSRRPALRAAAAMTLRHLSERSPQALLPQRAEPLLLAALDAEADPRVAGQLQATLRTLLSAGGAGMPSYWLALLADVVFAAPPKAPMPIGAPDGADGAGGGDAGARENDDDDDDDGEGAERSGGGGGGARYGVKAMQLTSPSGSATAGPTGSEAAADGGGSSSSTAEAVAASKAIRELLAAPRLRTRLFAAECLLQLLQLCVARDARHRDPQVLEQYTNAASRAAPGSPDLLILKLQALVDMGYKLATGSLEALRPAGVRLLALLVELFGEVPDPLMPGSRLMEQYQAQFVSALRSALGAQQQQQRQLASSAAAQGAAPSAASQHPLLQVAGAALATTFLESGLAAGDVQVMQRLMDLLAGPLASWPATVAYLGYADWVGARVRLELLRAHAQCAALALAQPAGSSLGGQAQGSAGATGGGSGRGRELCGAVVAKAQRPHAALLLALWSALLQDYVVLTTQLPATLAAYRSPLLLAAAPSASAAPLPSRAQQQQQPTGVDAEADANMEADAGVVPAAVGPSPELVAALRPAYEAAVPCALQALPAVLPPASALVAGSVAGQVEYGRLLEVALMVVQDAGARLAAILDAGSQQSSGAGAPAAALDADAVVALHAAARRLRMLLQGLQQLLAADYIAAGLLVAATAADVLRSLAAVATHCLMPMQRLAQQLPMQAAAINGSPAAAELAGAPPSLPGLAAQLVLPAAGLLRDLLQNLPEAVLLATPNGADEAAASSPPPSSQLSSFPAAAGADLNGPTSAPSSPWAVAQDDEAAVQRSPADCACEALLLLAAACCSGSSGGGGDGAGVNANGHVANGNVQASEGVASAAPRYASAQEATAADQCLSLLLAAAQTCIKRLPPLAAVRHAPALLEMPLQRLLAATPGGASALAAQRFLVAATTLIASKAASADGAAAAAASGADGGDGAAAQLEAIAAAPVVCLAAAAQRHLQAMQQLGAGGVQASAARLSMLLSAVLAMTAQLPAGAAAPEAAAGDGPAGVTCGNARRCIVGLLGAILSSDVSTPGWLAAMEALRGAVQEAAAAAADQAAAASQRAGWGRLLLAHLVPVAAERVHAALAGARQPLEGGDQACVSEAFKLLLLGATLAAAQGQAAQEAVMKVLVPLLVEGAAPAPPAVMTPALRDMSLKLITTLPTAAAGQAFKAQLAAQPTAAKLRLQAALREATAAAAAAAAGPAAAGAAGVASGAGGAGTTPATGGLSGLPGSRKPAIQLKTTFALPK